MQKQKRRCTRHLHSDMLTPPDCCGIQQAPHSLPTAYAAPEAEAAPESPEQAGSARYGGAAPRVLLRGAPLRPRHALPGCAPHARPPGAPAPPQKQQGVCNLPILLHFHCGGPAERSASLGTCAMAQTFKSLANHDLSKACGGEVCEGLAPDCLVCLVCDLDKAQAQVARLSPRRARAMERSVRDWLVIYRKGCPLYSLKEAQAQAARSSSRRGRAMGQAAVCTKDIKWRLSNKRPSCTETLDSRTVAAFCNKMFSASKAAAARCNERAEWGQESRGVPSPPVAAAVLPRRR